MSLDGSAQGKQPCSRWTNGSEQGCQSQCHCHRCSKNRRKGYKFHQCQGLKRYTVVNVTSPASNNAANHWAREYSVRWRFQHQLWRMGYQQKCKSTIDCATRTRTLAQRLASFPWTPVCCAAYSRLMSIHRVVRVGLWNYIQLVAGDGPIPVFTACSLRCYTGTVHYRWQPAWVPAWAPAWEPAWELAWEPAWEPAWKPAWKPLWKPAWEWSWESLASREVEFSTGNFWPMDNTEFVEALANRRL